MKFRLDSKHVIDIALVASMVALGVFMYTQGFSGGFNRWDWLFLRNLLVQKNELGEIGSGLLIKGFVVTLQLSLWVFIFSMMLGIIFGYLRATTILPLRYIAHSYVLVIRNIPPLVLLFIFYFFLGSLISQIVDWHAISNAIQVIPGSWLIIPAQWVEPFFTAAIALSVYQGTYISEIFRAGIESIPIEQLQAGKALGMRSGQLFLFVILPQAWRFILPPLVSQISILIKNSSLAAVITIPELVSRARLISDSSSNFLEVWITVALLYFAVCTIITQLGSWLEKKCAFQS